jgi:HSP20 family protein
MAQERRSTLVPERWQPLRDVEQVNERMRRLLEETFGGFPAGLAEHAWTPPVDIEETDDAYVVEAELPGVKREDVSIELAGNELSVTGEIKEKERTGIVRRSSRRVGRYELRVVLPDNIDGDKVDAKLKDGVLRVSVPKSERAERRHIEINS